MSEPFLSEIKLVSFNFAPKGWAQANGQLLPINQNQALFALLGTTYGGDGRVNFALPDLRGRVALSMGSGFSLGQKGGQATHTVTALEMPQHTHAMSGTTAGGDTAAPAGNLLAEFNNGYAAPGATTNLAPSSVTYTGGGQPHQNMMPFLTLCFVIALQGIFPSPT